MAETIDPSIPAAVPPTAQGPPVPAADDRAKAVAYLQSEEWRMKNDRRFALIHKKDRQGLSEEEAAELEQLQAEARRWLDIAHPLPTFDEAALDALERLAEQDRPGET